MIVKAKCSASPGAEAHELPLAEKPSEKQLKKLSSYLLNSHRGASTVRDIMIADIRGFIDLGVPRVAADLLVVLKIFLAEYPEARRITSPPIAWGAAAPGRPER